MLYGKHTLTHEHMVSPDEASESRAYRYIRSRTHKSSFVYARENICISLVVEEEEDMEEKGDQVASGK